MNQAELDALPLMGGFSYETRLIEGRKVRVAVAGPSFALWAESDEPCYAVSGDGRRYLIGWYKNVRYKRELR